MWKIAQPNKRSLLVMLFLYCLQQLKKYYLSSRANMGEGDSTFNKKAALLIDKVVNVIRNVTNIGQNALKYIL